MKILVSTQPIKLRARLHEIALFVGVGVLNTGIDFAVLNLLLITTHHEQGWWVLVFNGISFLTAAVNSYVLNGRFTFRSSNSGQRHDHWRFIRFIAVSAGGLIINSVAVWAMAPLASQAPSPLIALNGCKALATILSLCWNYVAIKHWIFHTEIHEMTHTDTGAVDMVNVTMDGE